MRPTPRPSPFPPAPARPSTVRGGPPAFPADRTAAKNGRLRMGSDRAGAAVLDRFLALCGSTDTAGCAFSAGSPKATRDRYDQLMRRRRQPPLLTNPSSCVKTYGSRYLIVGTVLPPGTICRQDEPPFPAPKPVGGMATGGGGLVAATS